MTGLKLLFGAILVSMIAVTAWAGSQIAVWDAWEDYKANPWAVATLFDAYFGFLTFYCWLAWREPGWGTRVLWFVLIMAAGNMAMAAYVLMQLFALKPGEGVDGLFQKKAA
jgi:hypothetical protein